jgi:hypothetical protein
LKDDARDIPGLKSERDVGVAVDRTGVGEPRAAVLSSNWAWAHRSDSYDWMDSAGPLSFDDMAG